MGHNTCKSMGRVLCVVRRQWITTGECIIYRMFKASFTFENY